VDRFSLTKEEVVQVLSLQEGLNQKYTTVSWREKVETEKFLLAMKTEIAEFLEVVPHTWKWWKKRPENSEEEVLLEIVDVFHFMLSIVLKKNVSLELTLQKLSHQKEYVASESTDRPLRTLLLQESNFISKLLNEGYVQPSELIAATIELIQTMCHIGEIDPSKVVDFYIKKNEFNHERIEAGYKDKDVAVKKTELERVKL